MKRSARLETPVFRLLFALLLGAAGAGSADPVWARQEAPKASGQDPAQAVETVEGVEYGTAGPVSLKLDIYRPKDRSLKSLPALLMIHGGGWKAWPDGQWCRSTDSGIARRFAEHGYWVASIDYRLSDQAPFPAALLDCKRAVRWVRSHASELGVDPERLGVWGFSAGGHLALLVGGTDVKDGFEEEGASVRSRVEAVAAWAPLTDLADPSGPRRLEGECKDLAEKFMGGPFQARPRDYERASPIRYASPSSPPTLLVHGDRDPLVPFSHSEAMLERLQGVGGDVSLLTVKGAGHLFFKEEGQDPPLSGMMRATLGFFDRHLRSPRALFFTHSAGFLHDVVKRPAPERLSLAEEALTGACRGELHLVTTQDPRVITAENLRSYAAVIFYTSGELPIDKEGLLEYVRSGGGFVCVHNGMATLMKYPPYGEMVGGSFDGHPWDQEITVRVEDPAHPGAAGLGSSFRIKDEIYQVKNWNRKDVHVLLSVDPKSVDLAKGKRADHDYALSWTTQFGKGRVFYTALGHYPEVWRDERFLRHLVGGIRWAMTQGTKEATPK
jgi:acetyl esterase/lipase/type 1 glutamine amidotransferase